MTKSKNTVEKSVSDAITQKPIRFSIGDQKFEIHPPTLGKMQVLSKLYLQLDIDEQQFAEEPHKQAMRVCEDRTDTVCELMSASTFRTEGELLDDERIAERAKFFKWNCYPEDFSTCLMAILTQVDYSNFMTSIRLTGMLRQNKPNIEGAVRVEQSGDAPCGEGF